MPRESAAVRTKRIPLQNAVPAEVIQLSRIVEAAPRKDPDLDSVARYKAGEYRVIHGRIAIALEPSTFTAADGKRIPDRPTQQYAQVGDKVWLNEKDATMMVNASIVEELDAKPSRVNKVWDPPKTAAKIY